MKPSERYIQLSSAATLAAQQYLERRERRCRACASASQAVALFLGMPEGRTSIIELDESLRESSRNVPIGSDVALRVGQDGFFYFGLSLHFENSAQAHFGAVTILVGVDVSRSDYVVKHVRSFEVEDLSEQSLRPFADHVYTALKENYETPYAQGRQSIGFINGHGAA